MGARPGPVTLLDCDQQSFGSGFVRLHARQQSVLDSFNEARVHAIQSNIKMMARRSQPERIALDLIDRRFQANDGGDAERDLQLDYPLNQNSVTRWLATASVRDVVSIGSWNTQRYNDFRRHFRMNETMLQNDVRDHTRRLVELHCMPPTALSIMRTAIGKTTFHLMDSFESGASYSNGYQYGDLIAMAIPHGEVVTDYLVGRSFQRVLGHESVHALGDQDRGFFYGVARQGRHPQHRWLEESVVSHFAQVVHDSTSSEPGIIHPNDRTVQDKSAHYPDERKLLGVCADEGDIDVDLLGAAYVGDEHDPARKEVAARLKGVLNVLFPQYQGRAFTEFSRGYERAYRARTHTDFVQQHLRQIEIEYEQSA